MNNVPTIYRQPRCIRQLEAMADSFETLLGRPLVAASGDLIEALWSAPFVVVAHGTEDDPLFFFGNARALAVFEIEIQRFVGMPSRLSAEVSRRQERQRLLDSVTRDGYSKDYAGIRISATGRRFAITGGIVWNIRSKDGEALGQAATFSWEAG